MMPTEADETFQVICVPAHGDCPEWTVEFPSDGLASFVHVLFCHASTERLTTDAWRGVPPTFDLSCVAEMQTCHGLPLAPTCAMIGHVLQMQSEHLGDVTAAMLFVDQPVIEVFSKAVERFPLLKKMGRVSQPSKEMLDAASPSVASFFFVCPNLLHLYACSIQDSSVDCVLATIPEMCRVSNFLTGGSPLVTNPTLEDVQSTEHFETVMRFLTNVDRARELGRWAVDAGRTDLLRAIWLAKFQPRVWNDLVIRASRPDVNRQCLGWLLSTIDDGGRGRWSGQMT